MKPQKQLFRHDPDNGVWGDCWRAAWATILDVDVASVPHFCEGGREDYNQVRNDWLRERGIWAVTVPYNGTLEAVLNAVGHYNSEPYLLTGKSPRGTSHVVVCLGSDIAHDPHPDGGGIVGPGDDGLYWIEFAGHILTPSAPGEQP